MSESEVSKGLLPIMSPLFNLREICKQMSLLEDHLNNPRKRCHDCIRKHFLTIEALFEEAISLDKEFKYGEHLDDKAEDIRELQFEWLDSKDTDKAHQTYLDIAQNLRKMRKGFAPICFDVRKMASIIRNASSYVCPHASRNMSKRIAHMYLTGANRILLSTRTESEREDQDVEGLVKRSPKNKPPRRDLKRKRIRLEDEDLNGLGRGHQGDPDLKREVK